MFVSPTRHFDTVFIHCTASNNYKLTGDKLYNAVRNFHVNQRGYSDIAYHGLIDREGTYIPGRDLNKRPAAQGKWNDDSLAFCLHGLNPVDFTVKQAITAYNLFSEIVEKTNHFVRFRGHKEVANKACPVINYKAVFGIDSNGKLGEFNPNGLSEIEHIEKIDDPKRKQTVEITQRGNAVLYLQNFLNIYLDEDLEEDGIFGTKTRKAVIEFQKLNNLPANGIVDENVWEKVEEEAKKIKFYPQ